MDQGLAVENKKYGEKTHFEIGLRMNKNQYISTKMDNESPRENLI